LRDGRPIPLARKAFDTLCVLVERHGSLVPKSELMTAIWPETTIEENNLDRNISTLRKALGEKAGGERFIETVPRLGYRFLASVNAIFSQPPAHPAVNPSKPPSPDRRFVFATPPTTYALRTPRWARDIPS
jgi:DNA-binding winged helix-turn-helix (wHTH) protein